MEDVRPVDELWGFVEKLAAEHGSGKSAVDHAYAFYYEKFKGDHNEKLRNDMRKALRRYKMSVRSCADMHFEDRLVLEPERIADARMAQQITDEAFRALLSEMKNMKSERDAALFLNYEMQRRGDGDLAFPTIAAGGKNACCLHYVKNDEALRDGELVLFDFGVRFGSLHSDISRTIPVNGKFNPLQKMLYEIVLESAKVYQRVVRPGVSLKEIGMICWEFIMMELERRLVKGAKGSLGKERSLRDVSRDNLDGLVGIQVVVRVYALLLVFGKVFRTHRLAEVVVERHDADEERVRSDGLGDAFGEVRNLDAVMERAWCEFRNALECRPVEVGHFHEREHGGNAENLLDDVDQEHGSDCGADDDVCACGDECLVERDKVESVAEEEHNANGECGGNGAGNHAPCKLDAVAYAEQRCNYDNIHDKACKCRCKVIPVQNAEEPCGERGESKPHPRIVQDGRDDGRECNRVQPHEIYGVRENAIRLVESPGKVVDDPEDKKLQQREEEKTP